MQQPLCSWSHPAVNREIMNIRFYLVTRSCQEVTNQSVGVCESGLNCTLWPLHAHTLNWLCIKNDVKRYRTKIYWQPQWFYLHWRMLMLVSKHPRSALFFFANVNIYIIKLNYCSLRRAEGQKQKSKSCRYENDISLKQRHYWFDSNLRQKVSPRSETLLSAVSSWVFNTRQQHPNWCRQYKISDKVGQPGPLFLSWESSCLFVVTQENMWQLRL